MRAYRIAHWTLRLFVCAAALGTASQTAAVLLSNVSATAGGTTNTTPITGDGLFTATATSGLDSSTASATVGPGGATFTLAQSSPGGIAFSNVALAPIGVGDSGHLFWLFSPTNNVNFSLAGSYTTIADSVVVVNQDPNLAFSLGGQVSSFLNVTLQEFEGATIFSESKSGSGDSTLALDPQNGALLAGHTYALTINGGFSVPFGALDPVGGGTITFALAPAGPNGVTVPLPRGAWVGLVLLMTAVVVGRRVVRLTAA